MATTSKTDKELWEELQHLDDMFLDPDVPEDIIDVELRAEGIDPQALAKRGLQFIAKLKEEERLAWRTQAEERRQRMEAVAAKLQLPRNIDDKKVQLRLDELRRTDPTVGTAIKMAAHKRKAEESSADDKRTLLEDAEILRAIEEEERGRK